MTFKTVKGDITVAFDNEEVDYIMHCVNCQGVWGAGLAKTLKGKYPVAFQDYIMHVGAYGKGGVLGDTVRTIVPGGQEILSCFGQEYYGTKTRQVDYQALEISLTCVAQSLFKGDKIGIPYGIGCGLAGGDWEGVVEPMITRIFDGLDVTFYKL